MISYANTHMERIFTKAALYRNSLDAEQDKVKESFGLRHNSPPSERHLQCVWYDPNLRPKLLQTCHGEEVEVLDTGRWNLERGPDFTDAVVALGPEQRRIVGDVEVHIDPRDWLRHGHFGDPLYENVRVHVTFFNAPLPCSDLPAGTIQISLKKRLLSNPYFAFENIDVAAYPYNIKHGSTPCSELLAKWSRPQKEALLDAAGEERLLRKAELFATAIESNGLDQALYIEIMRALGYKNNKAPFKYLAENLPISALREDAAGDQTQAYALLMGLAGLLPETVKSGWDTETRTFVRDIWDRWWKLEGKWGKLAIPQTEWTRASQRPQNRPERRLMAAASLFTQKKTLSEHWRTMYEAEPRVCLKNVIDELTNLQGPYWNKRLAWSGKPRGKTERLIGRSRAAAIAVNVFLPYLAACNDDIESTKDILQQLPSEAPNNIMRQTAHQIFGPDHPPALYRSAVRKQGLMQIFQDFCLNDRSGCRDCRFPALLRDWG